MIKIIKPLNTQDAIDKMNRVLACYQNEIDAQDKFIRAQDDLIHIFEKLFVVLTAFCLVQLVIIILITVK